MKNSSSLIFNIVFVPGAVRFLRLAVLSLAQNSRVRFRLVSNGCDAREKRFLEKLCRDNPHLEFLATSSSSVMPHGELLTELQSEEQSELFAFMDSDVFASGDFMEELAPQMDGADAIFSCRAIFTGEESQVMPRGYPMVHGEFNQYADGLCLGSSYFAIYDNAILTRIMEETGLTLRPYYWHEIPRSIQEELREENIMVAFYDTGKLINILLALRGYCCRFTQLERLCHIGGISTAAPRPYRNHIKFHLLKIMPSLQMLPDSVLKLLGYVGLYNGTLDMLSSSERRFHLAQVIRRRTVGKHIGAYLKHLELGTQKPKPFMDEDPTLVDRVRETESLLNSLHDRYTNDTKFDVGVTETTSDPVKTAL